MKRRIRIGQNGFQVDTAPLKNQITQQQNILVNTPNSYEDMSNLLNKYGIYNISDFQLNTTGEDIENMELNSAISKYLNIPYVYGGSSQRGIDCSGFTRKVYEQLGKQLRGNSIQQYADSRKINLQDARNGDLIFLKGTQKNRNPNQASHVAIITDTSQLADGIVKVAEAPQTGSRTQTNRTWNLNKGFYRDHLLGVGRVAK